MNKKIKEYCAFGLSGACVFVLLTAFLPVSCEKWTEPEAEDFYTSSVTDGYRQNIRDYLQSPHKIFFGWFGNWSGKSPDGVVKEGTLTGLPDSVDLVSLWLVWSSFTDARISDLREFQAQGRRAVLCWRAGAIGDNLTPEEYKDNPGEFWGWSVPGEDEEGNPYEAYSPQAIKYAAEKYAMAIVDTCRKYDIDGFDYDIEDNAGGSQGMWSNTALGYPANHFMLKLADEFDKDGRITMCDIPGPTWGGQGFVGPNGYFGALSDEVIPRLKYIAWQTYEESNLDNTIRTIRNVHPETGDYAVSISIFTGDFEDGRKEPNFMRQQEWGARSTENYAGHGVYHIEKDFKDDYPRVRKAISIINPPISVAEE